MPVRLEPEPEGQGVHPPLEEALSETFGSLERWQRPPIGPELETAEVERLAFLLGEEEGLPASERRSAGGVWQEPHPDALARAEATDPRERQLMLTLERDRDRQQRRLPALTEEQQAQVSAAASAARSERTIATYAAQWQQFAVWAAGQALAAQPAHPATVAAYLAWRAEQGASVSTLRVARAAISAAHRDQGHDDPTKHEGVARTVAGISRQQAARPRRQAQALTAEAMAAIRATARLPRPWRDGKRRESPERAEARGNLDIALCAVLRDGLLRRSEAAALTWADIQAEPNGTGRLTVKHSKTDQEGQGAVLYLSPETMRDLDRIRPRPAADPAHPVFGLSPARIGGRVQAAAKAAGLDAADLFSGHSGRVGMARDLVADGASLPEIMQAGRWASPTMPAHYARAELASQGAVARYYNTSPTPPDSPPSP